MEIKLKVEQLKKLKMKQTEIENNSIAAGKQRNPSYTWSVWNRKMEKLK